MKPNEIWEMELWEYNMYIQGYEIRLKQNTADCIMTGYYCGYYMSGSKNVKNPSELIRRLFAKKQSTDEGLKEIERIKKLDQGG